MTKTKLFPLVLSALALASIPLNAEERPALRSLSTAKDGAQTLNGLVSPLEQAGSSFYLRNEDGLIEVRLDESVRIGLLFREKGIRKMLEDRKIVLPSVGNHLVVKAPGDIQHGHTLPMVMGIRYRVGPGFSTLALRLAAARQFP